MGGSMNRVYFAARPSAVWYEDNRNDPQPHHAFTVHEPDGGPQETGLLDATGNKLFARNVFGPIGFDLSRK